MTELEKLNFLIDEGNYPYFTTEQLEIYLEDVRTQEDLYALARRLCLIKTGIEEIRLGDVTIPSPRNHFLMLARSYRPNCSKVVTRADGC